MTAPGAPAHAAASAPSLRACYDGKCKLALTKKVSFKVSPRFGLTRLSISFTEHTMRIRGATPGAMVENRLSQGASGSLNGIGIRVLSLSRGKAVIRLTPLR
ncbi:hypothetical protein [Thermoactinospora rubra]|uniref:hypothetical protein n=1 Tax=Thermoactinospora rubra TaxID=1088767 RepID=UPI000A0FFB08|nr:hypothetical protein [Thermoactinospora rubra]